MDCLSAAIASLPSVCVFYRWPTARCHKLTLKHAGDFHRQSVLLTGHTYQLFVHKRVLLITIIRKATTLFMQVVVDYRRLFIDAYIGWPGKVHDAWVLVNSSLSHRAMKGTLLQDWKRLISGVQVPLLILGDPAYPVLPWLMKPYPKTSQSTREQRRYNYRQSRARMSAENAMVS